MSVCYFRHKYLLHINYSFVFLYLGGYFLPTGTKWILLAWPAGAADLRSGFQSILQAFYFFLLEKKITKVVKCDMLQKWQNLENQAK